MIPHVRATGTHAQAGAAIGAATREAIQRRVEALEYDPDLVLSLPTHLAASSGMNALAHCAEAVYDPGCSPLTKLGALEGARVLVEQLADRGGVAGAVDAARLDDHARQAVADQALGDLVRLPLGLLVSGSEALGGVLVGLVDDPAVGVAEDADG